MMEMALIKTTTNQTSKVAGRPIQVISTIAILVCGLISGLFGLLIMPDLRDRFRKVSITNLELDCSGPLFAETKQDRTNSISKTAALS